MSKHTFSRRGVLVGAVGSAGGVAACSSMGTAGAGLTMAAAEGEHEHHEHHSDHEMKMPSAMHDEVLHALLHCKAMSEVCLTHCINTLATGDPSLAACAARVRETAAICDASITFVTAGSPAKDDLLAVCKKVCEMCEAECRKHAGHHQQCADCADSCVAVIEALSA